MSRRESRDSESKRHRSKFDREPSPKRSRRDGKPATERPFSNMHSDAVDRSDRDQKHSRRLRDALPLEAPPAPESKIETGSKSKESEKRTCGQHEGIKSSSNPTDAPRSRSFIQHDERGHGREAGRRNGRGTPTERGWWRDSKDQHSEKAIEKGTTRDTEQKDEKHQARRDDNPVWHHDGYYEIERDQQPPARKRPAFRERKAEVDSENAEKSGAEPVKPSRLEKGGERKEDREGHNPRYSDGIKAPFGGERDGNRRESQRGSFLSRDSYDGGGNYRGRERFNGRRGYQPSGGRIEKWKHDLFEEANRSPTPKNEEDQIAKVEALLAS